MRNDSFCHAAGDHQLRRAVDSMRTHLRSYDLIGCFVGDEFALLLLDLNMSEAAKRFDAIKEELADNQEG